MSILENHGLLFLKAPFAYRGKAGESGEDDDYYSLIIVFVLILGVLIALVLRFLLINIIFGMAEGCSCFNCLFFRKTDRGIGS